MESVKTFHTQLMTIYEGKPPVSKAKMSLITKTALKSTKFYKHIVMIVEKFIQKAPPEYKLGALYVIDSIVRQSIHQYGKKDVFASRFSKNLYATFTSIFKCAPKDKSKVIRVLNLWQKNGTFSTEIIQSIMDLATNSQYTEINIPTELSKNFSNKGCAEEALNLVKDLLAKCGKIPSTIGINPQHYQQLEMIGNYLKQQIQLSKRNNEGAAMTVDEKVVSQLKDLASQLFGHVTQGTLKGPVSKENGINDLLPGFNKKLLDFDYGDEDEEDFAKDNKRNEMNITEATQNILSNPDIIEQIQKHVNNQTQLNAASAINNQKSQILQQQQDEFDKQIQEFNNSQMNNAIPGFSPPNSLFNSSQTNFMTSNFPTNLNTMIPPPPSHFVDSNLKTNLFTGAPLHQQTSYGGSTLLPAPPPPPSHNMDFNEASFLGFKLPPYTHPSHLIPLNNSSNRVDTDSRISSNLLNQEELIESPTASPHKKRVRRRSKSIEVIGKGINNNRNKRDRDNKNIERDDNIINSTKDRSTSRHSHHHTTHTHHNRDRSKSRERSSKRHHLNHRQESRDDKKKLSHSNSSSKKKEKYFRSPLLRNNRRESSEKANNTYRDRYGMEEVETTENREKLFATILSRTLWIGHVPKNANEDDLKQAFDKYRLEFETIKMVPPRGCAYVCFVTRNDAERALYEMKDRYRLHGKTLQMDWSPFKGLMDNTEYKLYWNISKGAYFIPYDKLNVNDAPKFIEGGSIDWTLLNDSLKYQLDEVLKINQQHLLEQAEANDQQTNQPNVAQIPGRYPLINNLNQPTSLPATFNIGVPHLGISVPPPPNSFSLGSVRPSLNIISPAIPGASGHAMGLPPPPSPLITLQPSNPLLPPPPGAIPRFDPSIPPPQFNNNNNNIDLITFSNPHNPAVDNNFGGYQGLVGGSFPTFSPHQQIQQGIGNRQSLINNMNSPHARFGVHGSGHRIPPFQPFPPPRPPRFIPNYQFHRYRHTVPPQMHPSSDFYTSPRPMRQHQPGGGGGGGTFIRPEFGFHSTYCNNYGNTSNHTLISNAGDHLPQGNSNNVNKPYWPLQDDANEGDNQERKIIIDSSFNSWKNEEDINCNETCLTNGNNLNVTEIFDQNDEYSATSVVKEVEKPIENLDKGANNFFSTNNSAYHSSNLFLSNLTDSSCTTVVEKNVDQVYASQSSTSSIHIDHQIFANQTHEIIKYAKPTQPILTDLLEKAGENVHEAREGEKAETNEEISETQSPTGYNIV